MTRPHYNGKDTIRRAKVQGRLGRSPMARDSLRRIKAASRRGAWHALLSSCFLAVAPTAAESQLARLLQAVRDGGGWVRFEVEDGKSGYRSDPVPVVGLSLDGCFQVVQPRTGSWTLTARDMLGDGRIKATVEAGEPVRFSYEAGFRTQLDVVAEWSEPRNTTLVMWVGLETLADDDRDICEPPQGGGPAPGQRQLQALANLYSQGET